METYKWEIHSFLGEVKAKNMRDALVKALKNFIGDGKEPPYIGEEIERLDILVRRKKGK